MIPYINWFFSLCMHDSRLFLSTFLKRISLLWGFFFQSNNSKVIDQGPRGTTDQYYSYLSVLILFISESTSIYNPVSISHEMLYMNLAISVK